MPEYLYAAYDKGKLIGEKTSRDWEKELSISKQVIRDYARGGMVYGGRYTFRMIERDRPVLKEAETQQSHPRVTMQDMEKFKRSLKIGDKFIYQSYRKDFVKGSRVTAEKVVVVRKFPHLVKLTCIENPDREVTMTYEELLRQKRARARKRILTAGR